MYLALARHDFARARALGTGRVAGLQRRAQLGRDVPLGTRDGRDVVTVADERRHCGVVQKRARSGDGDGPDPVDLAALAGLGVAAGQRGAVDGDAHLDRLAGPSAANATSASVA